MLSFLESAGIVRSFNYSIFNSRTRELYKIMIRVGKIKWIDLSLNSGTVSFYVFKKSNEILE